MGLENATIETDGGEKIKVLFNPNQYRLEGGNQIAEIGIPGLRAPILQYVRGNARSLSLELFFDTYEQRKDVREHTREIYGLLGILGETHVPPICTFRWGEFGFRGIVASVSGRFTLFLPTGTPARATLSVTFKEYTEIKELVRDPKTESADVTKTRMLRRGDTLASLAAEEYGDPALWRPIAAGNRIDNPLRVEPGDVLVIPPLTRESG